MKYIRTKDGIYEISKILKNGDLLIKGKFHINKEVTDKYFKQADTIEELCDRFVAETCDNTKFWVELKLEYAKMYCGIKNIYGAVWTLKGLIFVAKMNEKGELVLI